MQVWPSRLLPVSTHSLLHLEDKQIYFPGNSCLQNKEENCRLTAGYSSLKDTWSCRCKCTAAYVYVWSSTMLLGRRFGKSSSTNNIWRHLDRKMHPRWSDFQWFAVICTNFHWFPTALGTPATAFGTPLEQPATAFRTPLERSRSWHRFFEFPHTPNVPKPCKK